MVASISTMNTDKLGFHNNTGSLSVWISGFEILVVVWNKYFCQYDRLVRGYFNWVNMRLCTWKALHVCIWQTCIGTVYITMFSAVGVLKRIYRVSCKCIDLGSCSKWVGKYQYFRYLWKFQYSTLLFNGFKHREKQIIFILNRSVK